MFQRAKFQLVPITSKPVKRTKSEGCFSMNFKADIVPLAPDASKEGRQRNEKVCQLLRKRSPWCWSGFGAKNYSDLAIKFDVLDGNQPRPTANVIIEGVLLHILIAEMSYAEPSACLKLKMSAVLEGTDWNDNYGEEKRIRYETDLVPSMKDGHYFHRQYLSPVDGAPETSTTSINLEMFNRVSWYWKLTNVCLSVEGINYDKDITAPLRTYVKDVMKSIQKTGLGSEVTIRYKRSREGQYCGKRIGVQIEGDDNLPLLASQGLLSSQSSVIKTRLDHQSKFGEGLTLELNMRGWTKREVLALLDFLTYGVVEKASTDPLLAIRLYEMGHLYKIQRLKRLMKSLLLRMPANSFGFDFDPPLHLFLITMTKPTSISKVFLDDLASNYPETNVSVMERPTDQLVDMELNKMASDILLIILPDWENLKKKLRTLAPLGNEIAEFSRNLFKMMHFAREGDECRG